MQILDSGDDICDISFLDNSSSRDVITFTSVGGTLDEFNNHQQLKSQYRTEIKEAMELVMR